MGIPERQFLFSKTLTNSWPSAAQIQHWTQVLGTLRARLLKRELPGESQLPFQAPAIVPKPGPDLNLLECVAALEEMHQALQRETAQRQELERAYRGTHKALAQAEADLAFVRSGECKARHEALHDELTALPNRRHLLEQLGHALATRRPEHVGPTVIYIDLDHFKAVNDTLGHQHGDAVLDHFAQRTQAVLRRADRLGRYGGEEFVVLLPETGAQDAQAVAQRIHAAAASGHALDCRLSIGLTTWLGPQDTLDAMLARADKALYQAKAQGRNQTCVA